MKRVLTACGLTLLCVMSHAQAAESGKSSKGMQFETATCSNVLDIFAAADPKLTKDQKILKGAQGRAFALVSWTHGYLNGRDGIDSKRYEFNQTGITKLVGAMFKACKDNDDKLYFDVVKNIH